MSVTRTRKLILLSTCGSAALALASVVMPQAAHAQAIQAFPTIVQGTVSIIDTVPDQHTITVTGTDAVIDWVPPESSTLPNFLPSTGTATFQGTPGAATFAVINRILPGINGEAATIDGHVISQVQAVPGGPFTPGGHVMFYSSTGLIIGPNAVLDVSGLMLTTLAPDISQFGAFATSGGTLALDIAGTRTPAIDVNSTAQVNAPAEGSYVVMASPSIQQSGTVTVNGSTVYALGDQMSLAHSSGLFDITITTGAQAGGLLHTGSTTGPASTGGTDNHVIYAVGRGNDNDPTNRMDLVFQGNLGFAPAVSATVENGVVVLAANYNVTGTTVINDLTGATVLGSSDGNVLIRQGKVTSDLIAHASHNSELTSFGGITEVDGDAYLYGRLLSRIETGDGGEVLITGDAVLDVSVTGVSVPNINTPALLDGSAGLAQIINGADGVTINGNTSMLAVGTPGADSARRLIGNATGGTIEIITQSTGLTLGGTLTADASGLAFTGTAPRITGGNATGGSILLNSENGGVITVTGAMTANALGVATNLTDANADAGLTNTALGGTIRLLTQVENTFSLTQSRIDLLSTATLNVSAVGSNNPMIAGGSATGGLLRLEANDNATIAVAGAFTGLAGATGGNGQDLTGADATGGQLQVALTTGAHLVTSGTQTDFTSVARGGTGTITGGTGTGGAVSFTLDNADISANALSIVSEGTGGEGTTTGGAGTGGAIAISATQANAAYVINGPFTARSLGVGGLGGTTGGAGLGGKFDLNLNAGRIDSPLSAVSFSSGGLGGAGATGGQATSGSMTILVENAGSINATSFAADISAIGGAGAPTIGLGGNATGGTLNATFRTDSLLQTSAFAAFGGMAQGGSGSGDAGGDATGGSVRLTVDASRVRAGTGSLDVSSEAFGGSSLAGGTGAPRGGNATGASATLELLGAADADTGSLTLGTFVFGGSSSNHEGGDATTATTTLTMAGASTLDIGVTTDIRASLSGGDTGGGDGIGGTASGALTTVDISGGSVMTLNPAPSANPPFIGTSTRGGDSSASGGTGGLATGGAVRVNLSAGGQLLAGPLTIQSETLGGNGTGAGSVAVAGGNAIGAAAQIDLRGVATLQAELNLASTALGGNASGAANGGNGTAGTASITSAGATVDLSGNSTLLSSGTGGNGQTGGTGTGGNVTVNQAASATFAFTTAGTVLNLSSQSFGGAGTSAGGNATSGLVSVTSNASGFTGTQLVLSADAAAGNNTGSTTGGNATGGTVQFFTRGGGTSDLDFLAMRALASTTRAGTVQGGTVQLVAQDAGSTLDATTVQIDTSPTHLAAGSSNAGQFRIDAIDAARIITGSISATAIDTAPGVETHTSRLQALAGGSISMATSGSFNTQGNLQFETAGGGIIYGGINPATLGGTIFANALGEIQVLGDNAAIPGLRANLVALYSGDIAINAGAGVRAGSLDLASLNTTSPMVLGGTVDEAGYTLLQAEAGRLQANSLTISAPATTSTLDFDQEIRNLTFAGSLQPGGYTDVFISTQGTQVINGQLRYVSAASGDTLGLSADRVVINLPAGSIAVVDGNTATPQPAGNLHIGAGSVFAADSNLMGQLIADPTNVALQTSLGAFTFTSDTPFASANSVLFDIGSYLLTQNTGVGTTLSGIVVGSGGLTIRRNLDFSTGPMRVITFGRGVDAAGGAVTNYAFFATVDYGTGALLADYTTDATLNTCNIVTQTCGPLTVPLTSDDLTKLPEGKAPLDASNTATVDAAFGSNFPSLFNPPAVDDQGLIDDPVTSGGKESEEDDDDAA